MKTTFPLYNNLIKDAIFTTFLQQITGGNNA